MSQILHNHDFGETNLRQKEREFCHIERGMLESL